MGYTSVPILVFLGLSVLDLGLTYATDRRQTSSLLNDAPPRNETKIWVDSASAAASAEQFRSKRRAVNSRGHLTVNWFPKSTHSRQLLPCPAPVISASLSLLLVSLCPRLDVTSRTNDGAMRRVTGHSSPADDVRRGISIRAPRAGY